MSNNIDLVRENIRSERRKERALEELQRRKLDIKIEPFRKNSNVFYGGYGVMNASGECLLSCEGPIIGLELSTQSTDEEIYEHGLYGSVLNHLMKM